MPRGGLSTEIPGSSRLPATAPEKSSGGPLRALFSETDVAQGKPARALATAAAEGRYEGEAEGLRKDASRFDAGTWITAVCNDDGCRQGFAAWIRATKNRKEAGCSRSGEEDHWKHAFEAAPIGMALVDADGQVLQANEAFVRMIGLTRADVARGG